MTDMPPASERPAESERPLEVKAEPFDAKREPGQRTYDAPPPKSAPPTPPGAGSSQATPPPPPRGTSAGWSVFAHLATLVDFCLPWFVIAWVPPLVIWLAKKDDDPEIEYHARESLNFQLNVIFWALAAIPLVCLCGLGAVIAAVLPFVKLALVLIASIRAADGQRFRYPYIVRLL
jgi:uncharacterized protein